MLCVGAANRNSLPAVVQTAIREAPLCIAPPSEAPHRERPGGTACCARRTELRLTWPSLSRFVEGQRAQTLSVKLKAPVNSVSSGWGTVESENEPKILRCLSHHRPRRHTARGPGTASCSIAPSINAAPSSRPHVPSPEGEGQEEGTKEPPRLHLARLPSRREMGRRASCFVAEQGALLHHSGWARTTHTSRG